MRTHIILLLLLPCFVQAQDTTAYCEFRFTLVDVQGRDLTSETLIANVTDVYVSDSITDDEFYAFSKIDYSFKDSCWILRMYDPMGYDYRIELFRKTDTVNPKLLELRKMVILYTGYDIRNNSGCKYCICNDIPFRKGEYAIDLPKKIESWSYLRSVDINIKNKPQHFYDVSKMQNWIFRNGG
ncbi:MAG: hypothetical protein R2794_10315 [Chitinophagales bacterium]